MNRIEEKMSALKAEGKKAFITYTTAGLPDMETTAKIMHAQQEAGIDIMELGVPFSDPVADGPVIQDASYEAIQRGATLAKVFELMKKVRTEGLTTPVVFMMYYNTVYHYGLDEEQGELKAALEKAEGAPILIQLVSPVSKDRIPMITKDAKGFVYCVSQMGVTGKGANFHAKIKEYLADVKKNSPVPVMMGFGIRTAKDVEPLRDIIDGAIVGSHFIKLMREHNFDTEAVKDYIKTFKEEMNS